MALLDLQRVREPLPARRRNNGRHTRSPQYRGGECPQGGPCEPQERDGEPEDRGEPLGRPRQERADLAAGLDLPVPGGGATTAYFSCCVPAFDTKMMNLARRTAGILKQTGAAFALLGSDENCCGERVRKAGNYALFDSLAAANIKAFRASGIGEIIVSSPHCYETFKNEYPRLGTDFKVVHIVQYLAGLVDAGRLLFERPFPKRVVYHDPCYWSPNGVYDEPRKVLSAIPGLTLIDEVNARRQPVLRRRRREDMDGDEKGRALFRYARRAGNKPGSRSHRYGLPLLHPELKGQRPYDEKGGRAGGQGYLGDRGRGDMSLVPESPGRSDKVGR